MRKWITWLLFDFEGRAGVFHMWLSFAAYFIAIVPIAVVPKQSHASTPAAIFMAVGILALLYFKLVIGVKRCHDHGWNGEMLLLSIIPIVNLYMFGALYLWPGNKEANKYGGRPGWFTKPILPPEITTQPEAAAFNP